MSKLLVAVALLATVGIGLKFASREDDDRAVSAHAQAPPDEARFQKVLLDNDELTQPMRIEVAPDGRLLYIERDGRVKIWNPKTQSHDGGGHRSRPRCWARPA